MFFRRLLSLLTVLFCLPAGFAEAEKTVTVSFAGDVTLGSEEWLKDSPGNFHEFARDKGYGYFFANVKDLFEQDDLTIVNLEGVLSNSAADENKNKAYRFRGPTDYAKILTEGSVEACAISNNHTKDFGSRGYDDTKEALEAENIGYFGNRDYWIFEKDGIRIAFFSFVSTAYESYRQWTVEISEKLKKDGVNAIVYIYHGGNEYSKEHNWMQWNFARQVIGYRHGDLVIMHHPHVVQGVDVMQNRYIFYSLGNFCFGGNAQVRALQSMVVQADLHFSDDGEFLGQQARIYPAHIAATASQDGDPSDFQPKLVTGEDARRVLELVQYDTAFELGSFDEEAGCLVLPYLPAETEE